MYIFNFNLAISFHCIVWLSGFSLSDDLHDIPAIARYFGPKGRYEEVNTHLLRDRFSINKSVLHLPSPGCRERQMTAIIRHGTRYPTTKAIKKMHWFYNFIVNNTSSEKSWLQEQWRVRYTADMDGRLVHRGEDDLRHLAVRLSKRFPALVSAAKLRGGFVKFVTSSVHRCVSSTLAFKRGLREILDIKDLDVEHEVNDTLMRFFEHCPRFVAEVDKNPLAVVEVEKFKTGPEMSRLLEKMADRLNLTNNNATYDMAEAGFFLCAYEFTINSTVSPWCQLFDEDDAQVMEYAADLREYWKRGYGHEVNFKSSCVLFHDVFRCLDEAAAQMLSGREVTNAVTFQIGHADTLLPLLTLLGFFKDVQPLMSANYAAQTERTFRTSRALPYAANLVLALYDCGGGELRVQTLLNEKMVALPGLNASQSTPPLYTDVRERYQDLLQECDAEAECQLSQQDDRSALKETSKSTQALKGV